MSKIWVGTHVKCPCKKPIKINNFTFIIFLLLVFTLIFNFNCKKKKFKNVYLQVQTISAFLKFQT